MKLFSPWRFHRISLCRAAGVPFGGAPAAAHPAAPAPMAVRPPLMLKIDLANAPSSMEQRAASWRGRA